MSLFSSLLFGVILAKDAWKTHQHRQIDRQYWYELPNGVRYFVSDGGTKRLLSNDVRIYWKCGHEGSIDQVVVLWDDWDHEIFNAEKWRDSQIDRSSYMRFRGKINLRACRDPEMIYDELFQQYVSWIKKVYIEETNEVMYRAVSFYDANMEAYLKKSKGVTLNNQHLMIQVDAWFTRNGDRGYIIEKKYIEEVLALVEKFKYNGVKYSEEKYATKEAYLKWGTSNIVEKRDVIPDTAELVERIDWDR